MIRAGLAMLAALAPVPAVARCVRVTDFLSNSTFRPYPANLAKGPWRAPDVSRGDARTYRSAIREQAAGAPDFAGQYRLVRIGCGAGTACPAIVDKLSGHVSFPPELRTVGRIGGFAGGDDVENLTYRRDSRLLVVFGVRNEMNASAGVTLYDWRGGRLNLVRFVPDEALCRDGGR